MKTLLALFFLCLSLPSLALDKDLERLFYSPQQRAQLDRLRQHPVAVDTENTPFLTVNGEVRRSSGQHTHWINGQAQAGARTDLSRQIPIGDSLNAHSGEQQSLLRDGQLHIKRAAP